MGFPDAIGSDRTPLDCIVAAPYDCSGRFAGCERMPAALRGAGLVSALGIEDRGNLQVVVADPVRDPAWGVIGLDGLVAANRVVRDAVEALLRAGRRPLLLGGDCTVLLGAAAALQRTYPEVGLAFIDGHLDCYDGDSSETGEGADMELAALLGVGASPLTGFGDYVPLIADRRVICLGPVDEEEAADAGAPNPRAFAPGMSIVDGHTLAERPEEYARDAVKRLVGADGALWIHLDLDVLRAAALPAVDYPHPEGLDWDELERLLIPLMRCPALIGMDVTVYNPTLDLDGSYARRIVRLLADAAGAGG